METVITAKLLLNVTNEQFSLLKLSLVLTEMPVIMSLLLPSMKGNTMLSIFRK